MAAWGIGRRMVIVLAAAGALAAGWGAIAAGAATLPDARSYELVSPPQKGGGDVMINSQRTWAASDGNAVAFASLTGFGDVVGTGVATDYLATRVAGVPPLGSQGWSVHAITPPQHALPVPLTGTGFDPMDEIFTADLDSGVFQSFDPLTGDQNVAGVANLYLRRGLRSASSPTVDVATACPACAVSGPLAPFTQTRFNMLPKVAGLSADGSRVLFESVLRLTSDATDGTASGFGNLYEYANGAVQSVGILPDGRPADTALAGQGVAAGQAVGLYLPRAFSSDGTRVAFTAAPRVCLLGGDTYPCGDLYLRDLSATPAATVQINASERTPPSPSPQPAIFWAMSADGRRVLFTTAEQLTNESTNSSSNLYLFDAAAPVGRRLTLLSVQDPSLAASGAASVDAVLDASSDDRTVYFASSAPLVAGDPPFVGDTEGIYMWRDTGTGAPQLRFVAPFGKFFTNMSTNRLAGSPWSLGYLVQSRVSPDGRFLLFSTTQGAGVLSQYGQSDYDHGTCNDAGVGTGCRELYVYDADAMQLRCASCRPDGATATVGASDMAKVFIGAASSAGIFNHALATNGRVFFSTAEALVPEDVNGRSDAYEWENGQVHLLTDGQSSSDSFFLDASPDGSDVFVVTRAQLTAWDTDSSYDLYDVREPLPGHPAGVPDPPAPPPACTPIEGCRGPALQPPPPTSVASVTFTGGNNLRQRFPRPVHCRAGKVRKRTSRGIRCVSKPKRARKRCPRSKANGRRCSKVAARRGHGSSR